MPSTFRRAIAFAKCGNVLSSTSFLEGLAIGELSRLDLDVQDSDYQLVVAMNAIKDRP